MTRKVENRMFLDNKDELLNGALPYYPVADEYAEEVLKNLQIYKREKVFYCGAFFVLGKQADGFKRDNKICAPLILFPCSIVTKEEGYGIEVDFARRTVNINFLNSIKKEGIEDLYEKLADCLRQENFATEHIGPLKRVLEQKLEDVNSEDVLLYPQLCNENKLKKLLQPKSLSASVESFKVVAAVGFGVIKRSSSTQGIISELLEMSKKTDFSRPIQYLFDRTVSSASDFDKMGYVPAILSESQERVMKAANNHLCSMVVGPPGTGKSYTIAALAIEQMSKGNTVLIASKTDEAVDVIDQKIRKDLDIDGVSIRAGKSEYKKKLKGRLSNLLAGTRKRPDYDKEELLELRHKIKVNQRKNAAIEEKFLEQIESELDWAKDAADFNEESGFFDKIKMTYLQWKNSRQSPHWQLTSDFLDNNNEYIDMVKETIKNTFYQRVHRSLYTERAMFRDFLKSITARQSSRQDMLFESINLEVLMNTFPIWSINLSDIYDVLPMKKELFDVLIIDEATQCDIASCLPAIQRAKRIVIVGDPKQLRHTSFISRSMQWAFQKKHHIDVSADIELSLDYRNSSILDLVDDRIDDQSQVNFLNEHYRSKPPIIRFSNKAFYDNALTIMTSMHNAKHHEPVKLIKCDGNRDETGVNVEEADQIIAIIRDYIEKEDHLNEQLCHSIGVLSPFRDQVDYLGSKISELDATKIAKHNIACGTAYSFQGEERDIMLISLAIDDDSHHSAIIHINKPDVFNVSITRARVKQYVFQSFTKLKKTDSFLSKYLSQIKDDIVIAEREEEYKPDHFLEQVLFHLHQKGIETWVNFGIAGLTLDIVFRHKDNFFGVDLIGYPGAYASALEINDYKTLKRAGIKTFALPYTYWKFDENNCLHELMQFANIPVENKA